jgi:DNA-binding NtrC family response regulator
VARAIYQHSPRAKSLFLTVTCAAGDPALLEAELFGHEAGAPAADRPRRLIGKFEQCNRGTLFLDEVADIPLATQAKILRLLEDQQFHRIGGIQSVQSDVRVIASTSRDLKSLVGAGRFNQELYRRLSAAVISLPPLRQRGDDLDLLAQFYLERLNGELGRGVAAISPQAMQRLHGHAWPGNVRELQSVLEQSLLRAKGTMLTPESLPELETQSSPAATAGGEFDFDAYIRERLKAGSNDLHTEVHLQLDRLLLPAALRFVDGNQLHAARILGIARQTLRNRLRELGLTIHKAVITDGQSGQGNGDRMSIRSGEEAAGSPKRGISSYH